MDDAAIVAASNLSTSVIGLSILDSATSRTAVLPHHHSRLSTVTSTAAATTVPPVVLIPVPRPIAVTASALEGVGVSSSNNPGNGDIGTSTWSLIVYVRLTKILLFFGLFFFVF